MIKYNIGWGLTNCCNMNCKFCYSKEVRHRTNECNINDWKKFVDENYESIDSINYGTGENSILDDFFYFIEYVRENYPNITQSVTSNGYISKRILDNEKFYDIFMKSIDEVDISLDFCTKEDHCSFRGQIMAYDWAIQTMKLLKDTDKKVTLVFVGFDETMTKENVDGLFKIAKEYNTLIRLNLYRPVSESDEINKRFILSYDKLDHILKYIYEKYHVISLSDALLGNVYTDEEGIKENTGIGSIRILPNGNICPSTYLITEEFSSKYNIKQKNVLEKIKFDEFIDAPIPKECDGCPLRDKCKGGVYDRRILWYGTLEERDPYCPLRNGDGLPKTKFKILKHGRVSVHDDYLPTLFFKN